MSVVRTVGQICPRVRRCVAACIIALATCFLASQSASADCQPNSTGLVGWWPGDGNASNILGTNNGTLQGGATANVVGMVGQAFNFDGTNNFVQIPDSAILRPTNLTIEAWVRFTGLNTPGTAEVGRQYLVFKQNSLGSNFEGYDLSKARIAAGDVFEFRVSTGGGQSVAVLSSTLINTGVWYHVAAVRGPNFLQIYVNGQLQRQTNVAFAQNYGTQPLYFGSSGQVFWDRKFRGTLDEVTLYNRALSSNEVAAVYNAGADGKCKQVIITTPPQSQNVQVGSNVTFSVSATGFAPLRYRWMFNNATIGGATNATLNLTNVQLASAGDYAVAVSNTLGVVTSTPAVLTISTPPVITNAPQSQTVIVGGSANFSVGAGGSGPLSFQWRRGNVPVPGATSATLLLSNVTTNDAGSYDVVVANPVGAVTSAPPAVLTVNVPPFIAAPPQSQTVIVSSNVSFMVSAGGTAPLSYQWRKAGSPLAGQTGPTLELLNVTPGDAGTYDVVVTNVAGAITSTPPAALTVNVPPSIVSSPASQTVVAGTNVNFDVVAAGTLPLSYQWRKAGLPLNGQTSSTLTLLGVTASDAGNYDVVVANVAGSVTSAPPASLIVNVPPFIDFPPEGQTVTVGTSVILTVGAGGTVPLAYSWYKDGTPLSGQTTESLALLSVTTNDAGNYTVVVTNVAGSVTSAPPATLTVNVPPFITNPPQNQTVNVGSNVSFSVVATGTEPLSYQWRKQGVALSGETGNSLSLLMVSTNDAGSYEVVVSNVAGAVTSAPPATLTVNVPPFITGPPQSQAVVIGSNANFNVVATGTEPLSYQWRKGGAIFAGQTGASLNLLSVSTNDAGVYDVVVANVAGVITSTPPAILTVNVPPFITSAPQSQTAVLGTNVSFSVVAGGTTPLTYQWRKAGATLNGQTASTLVLASVSANDAGSYDVVVSNIAGAVTSVPPATLTVNIPPFITNAPQSQTVSENGSVALTVGAGGTVPLSYQWRKGGLPLGGQVGPSLEFASVTLGDAGSYDVVVANVAGSVTSTPPAILTVNSAASGYPSITNAPQSQTAVQGANVTFVVGATGSSPLRYQWRKQGINVANGTNATLVLSAVVASDAGAYDVVVTNLVGSVTSTPPAGLTIIPPLVFKPAITNEPQSQRVGIGTTVNFTVGASGTGPLSFQWRKDNLPISGQTGPTLTLLNVSTNNDGNYDVVVTNISGSVTSTVANLAVKLVVDPELEKAILCSLTNQPVQLTAVDLQSLVRLSARNRDITNLFGLQFAVNLTSIDLSQNRISDLSPLQGLGKLAAFELDDNRGEITTITPLAGLTNLSCLVLGQVQANSYAPLSGLSNLTTLVMRKGNVANLNFAQNLRRLSSLSLPQNSIRNITGLGGLTNLSHLDLRWNPTINSYSPLQNGLSNLTSLHLAGNEISNPPLQGLTRLKLLDLADNRISSLPSLLALTNLNYLVLSRNPLTDFSGLNSLTNLRYLELSGNNLSNAAALSGLTRLTYADLSFNQISDVAPLTAMTNLQGLVLAGNRPGDFAPLANLSSVSNLWLQGCAISNLNFTAGLHRLRHLNLDENFVSDLSPVLSLTNLTGLGLSRNPITNLGSVSSLVNLTGLRLEGNKLSAISPLTNLFRLTYLSLNQNQVTNAMPLASLTNLQSQYLKQNRLRDISHLWFQPRSLSVDLSLNLLNPGNGTPELSVIEGLRCQQTLIPQCACALPTNAPPDRGVDVSYLVQHTAPEIFAPARWFIPWNTGSSVAFDVSYNLNPADPLPVTANSANQGVIENGGLTLGHSNYSRSVTVVPKAGQTGDSTVSLTVVNEGGLSSTANIQVSVLPPTNVTSMFPPGVPIDPDLEFALRQASGKYVGELTSVDLLNITRLAAANANFTGFSGWQWLTNLNTLFLNGGAGDLGFLTNLPQLTTLQLDSPAPGELPKLAMLTSLVELELTGTTISNLSFLTTMTGLKSLGVSLTRVMDLSPLSGLTNLNQVRCQRNMLTNMLALYSLPQLSYVDVRYNLLDVSPGSLPLAVIAGLQTRGVDVDYSPQRAAPIVHIAGTWNISSDRTSVLTFSVYENDQLTTELVGLGSWSSNTGLLPDANQGIFLDTNSSSVEWALLATPIPGQSGSTWVTIMVTNDVWLSSSTSVVVTVSHALPLNEDFFGMTDLTWQVGGDVGWFGQTTISTEGFPAAQSGGITHGQESILESTLIGPGTLRFWWKVSSEPEYDWLSFESAHVTNQISGEVDWEERVVTIAPKTQTVRWRYSKDQNVARGMDAAWVARVTFVPATWLELLAAPTNSECHLALYGVPGQEYEMQVSTNTIDWLPLATILSTNRIMPFMDVTATNAVRFYRAKANLQSSMLDYSDQTESGFDLSWPGVGVLEASPTLNGPWEEVGGVSPFHVSTRAAPVQYFRVKVVGD